ncbi:MAG: mobB2 [Bacillota bacterium]|jgi:molybdopterin-guanine dinucleotide biosynthesis protein B|nr:mobB2 [Bacillota bacterium]
MKVFSVIGISDSGKTTTIEKIIKELIKRNYTVGTVKEIRSHDFKMDVEGTNTFTHKQAGSSLVTVRGSNETDIMHQERMSVNDILKCYSQDFVILEGVRDTSAPKIVTAHDQEGIESRFDETVFAISGRIAAEIQEYKGLPAINAMTDIEKLVDLIEEKTFDYLPDLNCKKCGLSSCKEMSFNILNNNKNRNDCITSNQKLVVKINGKELSMIPFVENIFKNTIEAVAKELKGYSQNGDIEIYIKR